MTYRATLPEAQRAAYDQALSGFWAAVGAARSAREERALEGGPAGVAEAAGHTGAAAGKIAEQYAAWQAEAAAVPATA